MKSTSSSTTNTTVCSNQLPYSWNGTNYNTAGTYVYHTLNAVGCDSAATLNLIVKATSVSTTNTTVCSNQLPYSWNGTNYNAAGTYVNHTLNAVGCDSAATLNLTVKSTSSSITNTTICSNQLPYIWNSTSYNAAGTYVYHTLNAVGCDSAATLNLILKATSSSTTNTTVCSNQLPYNWNGTNYNAAGTYVYHTLNAVGCDSAATLNLIVNSTSSSTTNTTVCSNQLPNNWNGTNYNAAGTYVYHTLNAVGCDSAATLNLTVKAVNIISSTSSICQGQFYTLPWGPVVNTSGIYKDTMRYSISNCDSIIRIVNLTVTPAVVTNTSASICSGDNYLLPWGVNISSAGIYKDTLRTSSGCDSLIRNINLTVKPKPTISISKSNDIDCMLGISKLNATGGGKYLWSPVSSLSNPAVSNPVALPTATTMYTVQVTATNGCMQEDSIVVTVNNNGTDNGFLMPNAFTPNGDGINDCFGIKSWGNVTDLKFQVFNRWGELIFRTTDPSQCWDGTYKGEKQSSAVFVYQVWAGTFCGRVYRDGTVTLIR